jgi:hypothetical protein
MTDQYKAIVESGVSADQVSTKILIYENDDPPATHVTATKDKDGTYTITAYYLIDSQPAAAPGPGPAPGPDPDQLLAPDPDQLLAPDPDQFLAPDPDQFLAPDPDQLLPQREP